MSEFRCLRVDELILDKNNPRIQAALEFHDTVDDVKIGMALGANAAQFEGQGTTYQSLRDSIKQYGGIFNPIIVNENENGLLVVEGNTRVHIYRDFIKNNVPGNWNEIPAIVYQNAEKEQMDAIRLQAHLVGPREWDAYSKAKYLHKLSNIDRMPINQIIDYCGGKKKDIEQYISGFILMEDYYRPLLPSDDQFDKTRFSAFIEVQKSNIPNILLANKYTYSDFSQWIIDDKFDRLEHVRKIPRIFSNSKAKELFIKKGSAAAIKELDKNIDAVPLDQIPLNVLMSECAKKIRQLELEKVREYSADTDFTNKVNDLYDEVEYLREKLVIGED